jgi:hypothetical protein
MADHDSLQISRRDALRVLGVGLGAGVVGSVATGSLKAQASGPCTGSGCPKSGVIAM